MTLGESLDRSQTARLISCLLGPLLWLLEVVDKIYRDIVGEI